MDLGLLLNLNPVVLALMAGMLGLIIGSFLNVVIYRLPVMLEQQWRVQCRELATEDGPSDSEEPLNLLVPRSRCPECKHAIGAMENIPVVSYLLQRGRCKHCGTPIPMRYPAVELATALLSAIVTWYYGPTLQAVAALLLTWALVALSVIDYREQLLPDSITLPFLWFGIALSLLTVFTDLKSSVLGAMAGYLALWSVYHLFRILTGKEGMGFGDFKLLAMLGAWLGWQYLPAIVIVSSMVGAIIGLLLITLRGRDRNVPIPFGPFLALAGWITLLWGDQINHLYLQLAGLS
jgi:leader peptidase (prepilin peptidase)/N-methyltransferase